MRVRAKHLCKDNASDSASPCKTKRRVQQIYCTCNNFKYQLVGFYYWKFRGTKKINAVAENNRDVLLLLFAQIFVVFATLNKFLILNFF